MYRSPTMTVRFNTLLPLWKALPEFGNSHQPNYVKVTVRYNNIGAVFWWKTYIYIYIYIHGNIEVKNGSWVEFVFNICHPEVFNTYINIQWCISQTQQNFIMFIIALGQHVSILTESSSGRSKNTDPYLALFKMRCGIPNACIIDITIYKMHVSLCSYCTIRIIISRTLTAAYEGSYAFVFKMCCCRTLDIVIYIYIYIYIY